MGCRGCPGVRDQGSEVIEIDVDHGGAGQACETGESDEEAKCDVHEEKTK
jgi:hypothetical protein